MTQFICKGVKQINKCKQESDNLWCRGKFLISIKRAMNSSRIELSWLVWDQSRSKYYLRTKFQDLSAFFVSAGVPNGEFPEILIAKCRSRFYCTWFFSQAEDFESWRDDGRDPQRFLASVLYKYFINNHSWHIFIINILININVFFCQSY
jgi:hypothetical protein